MKLATIWQGRFDRESIDPVVNCFHMTKMKIKIGLLYSQSLSTFFLDFEFS